MSNDATELPQNVIIHFILLNEPDNGAFAIREKMHYKPNCNQLWQFVNASTFSSLQEWHPFPHFLQLQLLGHICSMWPWDTLQNLRNPEIWAENFVQNEGACASQISGSPF